MYLTTILLVALISFLVFTGYKRPWVTESGAFRHACLYAGMTLLQIGISMMAAQQFALRLRQNYGDSLSETTWPEDPKTLLTISFAATALSWIFLILTLRGVFKVLSLWNPDRR